MNRRHFIHLSLAGLGVTAQSRALLGADESAQGELLYNGIRLPAVWPPHISHPAGKTEQLPPHLATPPAVIPIDVGRQLFVDDFLIEQTGLKRTSHLPEWHPANPILQPDQPWEKLGAAPMAAPFSDGVWWDPRDRLFKLWYMAGYRQATALAVSEDGIKWQKRDCGVVAGTNIVHTGDRDSASVWLDLDEPDPKRRFRLYRAHREEIDGRGQWWFEIHLSADGIHWSEIAGRSNAIYPRSTVFRNPFRRVWGFGIRKDSTTAVGRCRRYYEGKDGIADAAKEHDDRGWWIAADASDIAREDAKLAPQLSNIDCAAYESVMLGLLSLYRGKADAESGRPELNDVCAGFSRDGFHFARPDRRPFLAMSEKKGDWNWGNVQSAGGGCLVVGDKLYFYASGRRGGGAEFPDGGACTGLATLRRDGFVSLDADATPGTITTRTVKFSGKHLCVNLAAPQGELRAEVLDPEGKVIAPFTRENCVAASGDRTLIKLVWKGGVDLSRLAGQPVKFRFHLTNGALYAFWVSPDGSGASHGYVAGGGPGFSRATDTVGNFAAL